MVFNCYIYISINTIIVLNITTLKMSIIALRPESFINGVVDEFISGVVDEQCTYFLTKRALSHTIFNDLTIKLSLKNLNKH